MGKLQKTGLELVHTFTLNSPTIADRVHREPLKLPDSFINRLYLSVKGTLNVTGALTSVHPDAAARVLRDIKFRVDGEVWKSGDMPSYFRFSQYIDRSLGINDGLTGTAIAAYPFHNLTPLIFTNPFALFPNETLFDARDHTNMVLEITEAPVADLHTGGVATLDNVVVEVYAETMEVFDFGDVPPQPFKQRVEVFSNVLTASANPFAFQVSGGEVVPMVMVRAEDAGIPLDNIVTKLTLALNGKEDEPFRDIDPDVFRGVAQRQFSIDIKPAGYYMMNFTQAGKMRTGIGSDLPKELRDVRILADTVTGAGATELHMLINTLFPQSAPVIAA